MKIYLKEFKKTRKSTVKSLLHCLLSDENNIVKKSTWTHILFSKATFHDVNCQFLQCSTNKRRSFEDMVDLCKTYFPNVTDKKVAKSLEELFKEFENEQFGFLFCPDISKWVLVGTSNNDIRYCNNYARSHLRTYVKEYKYSLEDILTLMGYKDSEFQLT